MAQSQGKTPLTYIHGRMCGLDCNGNNTNNSIIYRGRPYARENCLDQVAEDNQREVVKLSWQTGLRVLGVVLTTGIIQPNT